MSLTERLNPDRRETDITPLIERRGGQQSREPVVPRWVQWTRENESRGKSLDERRAA